MVGRVSVPGVCGRGVVGRGVPVGTGLTEFRPSGERNHRGISVLGPSAARSSRGPPHPQV